MARLAKRHRLPQKPIHPAGVANLLAYHWPGNVRELSHELERAIVFEENQELKFEKLLVVAGGALTPSATPYPLSGAAGVAVSHNPGHGDWFNAQFIFPHEGFALEEAINLLIHHALKQTGGNVSAAARLLGVSRDYVRYRLSGQKQPEEPGNNDPAS